MELMNIYQLNIAIQECNAVMVFNNHLIFMN